MTVELAGYRFIQTVLGDRRLQCIRIDLLLSKKC